LGYPKNCQSRHGFFSANPKKEQLLSIPCWNISQHSFVLGAQITFLGSFGIVTLAMTEGSEAAEYIAAQNDTQWAPF
jgi:hypothetical protein